MADLKIPRRRVEINAEYVRSILSYDPETGIFTWRHRPQGPDGFNTAFAGKATGALHSAGYLVTRFAGGTFYLHRLAWLVMTGEMPPSKIDHINCDKTDNRWANLRVATDSENSTNQHRRSNNTSGFKGVSWNKRDSLWEAYIDFGKKRRRLGRFTSITDARDAYRSASRGLHGEFSRLE